jgi:putative heme-binding domain-containing protein
LTDRETDRSAVDCIAILGGPPQAGALTALARRNPSSEILFRVIRSLDAWQDRQDLPTAKRLELDRAIAELQGDHGVLLRWHVRGPVPGKEASRLVSQATSLNPGAGWRTLVAKGTEAPLNLDGRGAEGDVFWLAYSDVVVPESTTIQVLAASTGTLRVWLNGRLVHQRDRPGAFRLDSDRFAATLKRGANRIVLQVSSSSTARAPVKAHLRFRRASSRAEHEKLFQAALTRVGDPRRGRAVFFNAEKSQCIKCHRLGDQGERIGPELTGLGGRFSRIYIIESILEPSRTIAPAYQTWQITLKNGRQLSGIKVAETDRKLTVGDSQGQKHELLKAAIDEQCPLPQSTMPEGLEKRLSADEFIDLIAFLTSQKRGAGGSQ